MKKKDLTGKTFGKLKVIEELPERKDNRIVYKCRCECGNVVDVKAIYLTTKETRSCGCIKTENEHENLRQAYDDKRIDGVAKQLFKGKEPRKDSSTGYRGVFRYYTRTTNKERFKAWITVKGKKYYKGGFETAEDAYYNGRLDLEDKYLPKGNEK